MPQKIVDLRSPASGERPTQNQAPTSSSAFLQWTAYEYPTSASRRTPLTLMGLIACVLIVLGAFTKNYFFVAFIIIAFAAIYMSARRSPRVLSCAIMQDGVRVDKKTYPIAHIESFWIFEYPEGNELSLFFTKGLNRFLRVPLGNIKPERVRLMLRPLIQEKEQTEFISDQIARSIGF